MPRNVRNFWIELTVDGITKHFATGPRAKDGGFSMVIKQRDGGSVTRAMEIDGRVTSEGKIVLSAQTVDGARSIENITAR